MKSERNKNSKIGSQLPLFEVAKTGGMVSAWPNFYEHYEGDAISLLEDPEAGLAILLHKLKGPRLRKKDFNHEWRQKLKALGVTDANKQKRVEEIFADIRQRLNAAGAGYLIEKESYTPEDKQLILGIIREFKSPIRDLDSTAGITIYPSEASWRMDIYDAQTPEES